MSKTITGTTIKDRIKDAIEALRGKPHHSMTLGIEVKRCRECERDKPRRGTWEKCFFDTRKELYGYTCSACCYGSYHSHECKPIWDYCPNCGAKMEGEAKR